MMLRSTQLIVLSEVLSLKSLLKNITCLKLFMITLNFILKNVKLYHKSFSGLSGIKVLVYHLLKRVLFSRNQGNTD